MTDRRPFRPIVLLVAIATIAAASGCSSSSKGAKAGSATAPTSTSVAQPLVKAPYAKAGPFAVGFTTLHLAGNRRVVVWYPAPRGSTAGHHQESIDIANLLSPALQAKIPANAHIPYPANAYENAPAATSAGAAPLVLFSHGFAGYPEQSLSITTHLASWGFVVAAPDHVERSLDGLLGTAGKGVPQMTDVAVLQATLDLLVKESKGTGLLHGMVDPNRVVAAGHSAGAGAAYTLASADPRIKAWISYAVGFGGRAGPAPPAPTKPGMVMYGTTDGIIPAASSVRVFAGMHAPKYAVKIVRAGHLVFSDICLIARDAGGIVAIARALKLPIPESLLKLGSDGCTSDHPRVDKAFPAINQLTVAFFRSVLGIDKTPMGLDTAAVADLGAALTVTKG